MLNYRNFLNRENNKTYESNKSYSINEDLSKSRKFLKDMYLVNTVAEELGLITGTIKNQLLDKEKRIVQMKDFSDDEQKMIWDKIKTIKLDKTQLKDLEKTPEFQEIRKICEKNLGYLYMFVYFYYAENVPIGTEGTDDTPPDGIRGLYKRVIDNRDLLGRFPKMENVGKAFDINFIDETLPNSNEGRTNAEILSDGLDNLDSYRKVKKIIDQLPRKMRDEYKKASNKIKKDITDIAEGFDNIPTDSDPKLKDKVWRNFFGEMRLDTYETLPDGAPNPSFGKKRYMSKLGRYLNEPKPLESMIKAAREILNSFDVGYVDLIDKITECNDKFTKSGVNVVLDENGIIVIDVLSYSANKFLNYNTSHCIATREYHWNEYVGHHNNKQYYIYNTNLPSIDAMSVIGTTIKPGQDIRATHDKRDNYINDVNFKRILREIKSEYNLSVDLWSLLKPLTHEEIEFRNMVKEANRRIVEADLSLDDIKRYVEEFGADVNKDNAIALTHAVREGDIEKVTYLLDRGADPNLEMKENERAISFVQDINMLTLLVERGAEMTETVFMNVINSDEDESLKFCLEVGLSPNLDGNRPLREVIKGSYNDSNNGDAYFSKFVLLIENGVELVNDRGVNILLNNAIAFNRREIVEYCIQKGLHKGWDKEQILNRAIGTWVKRNRKMSDTEKKEWTVFLEKLAEIV